MSTEREPYDSTPETDAHIERVQDLCDGFIKALLDQSEMHDASKLESPEKETFDGVTLKLRGLTYGSDEYNQALADMKPALDHHYSENRHHPEHSQRQDATGLSGMDLVDIVEMLCDWKAATERHANGSLDKSIEINRKRFGISDELVAVLRNPAERMGWLCGSPEGCVDDSDPVKCTGCDKPIEASSVHIDRPYCDRCREEVSATKGES